MIIIAMALVSGTALAQKAKEKSEVAVKVNNSVNTGHQKTAAKAAVKNSTEVKADATDKVNKGSSVSAAAKAETSDQVKAIDKTATMNKGQQVKEVAGSGQEVKAAVHTAQDKPVKVVSGSAAATAAQVKVNPVHVKPVKASAKASAAVKVGLR